MPIPTVEYKNWEFYGSNSNACYARVLRAVVDYNGKIYSTWRPSAIGAKEDPYAWVTFLIGLPLGTEQEFAKITKTELHSHNKIGLDSWQKSNS